MKSRNTAAKTILTAVTMVTALPIPFFGAVHVAFPQLKAQVGCAAVADHHGQSQSDDGNGKYDVGGTIAQIPHTVADKDLIDDVVQ